MGVGEIAIILLVLGGGYILVKSGKLQELMQGQLQIIPAPATAPEIQPPPTRGGTKTVPAPAQAVKGGEIYPTGGKVCTNVTDGEVEMHGDPRREPQITCGANFENAEVTGYFMVPSGSDTISLKMRGPKHSGIPDAQMCNNIHYFPFGGNTSKPFGKQFQHTAEYCDFGTPLFPLPNFLGKWIGVKAIEWNKGSTVHMESWIDFPEGSGWKKWAEFDDVGSSSGCQKAPVYLKSPCSVGPVSIGYRIDGAGAPGTQFKSLSAREIAIPAAAKSAYAYKSYDRILGRL